MSTLQDFDLRSRGVIDLSESWKLEREDVCAIWRIEDVVAEYSELLEFAVDIFDDYCRRGEFPNPAVRFSYFADILSKTLAAARQLSERAKAKADEGQPIDGLAALERHIAKVQAILDEDNFAYDMAMLNLKD